jgi:hypothetical protein
VGNTGGSYDRASGSITFGNVRRRHLHGRSKISVTYRSLRGQRPAKRRSERNVVFYPHWFNAGSGGGEHPPSPQPAGPSFCTATAITAAIDAGENIISAAITILLASSRFA